MTFLPVCPDNKSLELFPGRQSRKQNQSGQHGEYSPRQTQEENLHCRLEP